MSVITNKIGSLEFLTAEGITTSHCFTTRFGGVSQGPLSSMNLAIKLDETEENVIQNYRILGDALGTQGFLPQPGKALERPSSTLLEARFPYHGSGAMTRSPSPLAWRPDFPGAPREAH